MGVNALEQNPEENSQSINDLQDLINIDPSNLPLLLTAQVNELNSLNDKIKDADNKATDAKNKADEASQITANRALFRDNKKEAIESLQTAGKDMTSAIVATADAFKKSFEFQVKLAEISQALFAMGIGNLTMNRLVVRELELKLKNASEQEISELAREELLRVVKQLKQQQDLLQKQEHLSQKVKEIREEIGEVANTQSEHENEIISLTEKQKEHEALLTQQVEIDRIHDKELSIRAEKDEEHDRILEKHTEADKRHDKELEIRAKKDELHDQELAECAKTDQRHDEEIQALQQQFHDLRYLPLLTKVALFVTSISLVAMIVLVIKLI